MGYSSVILLGDVAVGGRGGVRGDGYGVWSSAGVRGGMGRDGWMGEDDGGRFPLFAELRTQEPLFFSVTPFSNGSRTPETLFAKNQPI